MVVQDLLSLGLRKSLHIDHDLRFVDERESPGFEILSGCSIYVVAGCEQNARALFYGCLHMRKCAVPPIYGLPLVLRRAEGVVNPEELSRLARIPVLNKLVGMSNLKGRRPPHI